MSALALMLVISANIKGILISFLVLILILAVVAGLIWFIETYINKAPFPAPVRFVIALVVLVLVVIWALNQFS
jgi:hypothetical protein